jgi:HEAT repeat protein
MSADHRLRLGIFTTDEHLVVRTWDAWIAETTGIAPEKALHRAIVEVLPEIETRGHLGVLENVVTRGTVEVLSPALHHYLYACAPSSPATFFDRMQQHVTVGPLRQEGRIIGLVVTVEDVTARMDHERQIAAGQVKDVEALTQLLGESDWRTRRTAVTTLAERGNAIVDVLVRTIQQQHDNLGVLSGILDLLALSDIDIVEPIARFLDDDDANLRVQAALILGERRDPRATPALIAHLGDPDVNVTFHVIEALGRLHATEASEPLMAIAETKDFFLAFPAIQSLSRLGTSAVAPRLVPLLVDEMLRAPVIEALGELGDEEVTVPLVRLLDSSTAPTEVITEALAALYDRYENRYAAGDHIATLVRRSISAAGTQQMLDAITRVSADRLAGLAKVLGWLEGEAVQRALTRLLGHGAVRSQVVEALVRYGSGVVELLIEQLRAEDLDTRQAAAVALGRIGDRRATRALIDALGDRELAISAAGALASIGDGDAFEALLGLLREPTPAIRQSAIAALHSIGHPDMPNRIVPLFDDPDANVREAALKIAGYFGYPACLDRVLACCDDASDLVRRTAVEQLPFFDDPRAAKRLLQMSDDAAASVRVAAATAIGRIEEPERVDTLLRMLEDSDAWVRYVSLRALGSIRASRALPAVLNRLEHDSAIHVRLAAVEVVGRLAPANASEMLDALTHSPNDDIARAAIAATGHVDEPGSLKVLEREVRAPMAWRRLAALDALSARTDPRLSQILQWVAAADSDADVVNAAFAALVRLGSREDQQSVDATHALITLTTETSRRQAAIAALCKLPVRRIDDIRTGLHHSSPVVRCAIVEALGRMKHPIASRAVEDALDDAAVAVRLAAVTELKHLGTRGSQRKLMHLARTDSAPEVRQAAVMAVARAEQTGAAGVANPR